MALKHSVTAPNPPWLNLKDWMAGNKKSSKYQESCFVFTNYDVGN